MRSQIHEGNYDKNKINMEIQQLIFGDNTDVLTNTCKFKLCFIYLLQ